MKLRLVVLAAAGLALALYLVKYIGWRAVFGTAIAVGWGGFAILCLCALALFVLLGAAWWVLLSDEPPAGPWVFVWARMVRDSAAEVLPFSQLGGIAFGVRAAVLRGLATPLACASMIVDVTTEMMAQIAYAALGIVLLVTRAPRTSFSETLTRACLIGLALAAVAAGLFVALQRYGERITAAFAARLLRGTGQTASAASAVLAALYRAPGRVALSTALHFAGWLGNAVAAWIGFRLVGARVGLAAVVAIESLVYAARSVAVIIPNALGVQEGTYALVAPLFGVGAEFALAVSVLKRARDIAVGVPVLLAWQVAEGRRALVEKSAEGSGKAST